MNNLLVLGDDDEVVPSAFLVEYLMPAGEACQETTSAEENHNVRQCMSREERIFSKSIDALFHPL